jgi:hypothetical protein
MLVLAMKFSKAAVGTNATNAPGRRLGRGGPGASEARAREGPSTPRRWGTLPHNGREEHTGSRTLRLPPQDSGELEPAGSMTTNECINWDSCHGMWRVSLERR